MGDMKAFETIYHRFYRRLYNYGYTIFADKEVIKDCLHELFLELWERRSRLSEVGNIHYYLLVSFRRRIIHSLNSRKRFDQAMASEPPELSESSAEDRFIESERQFIFSARFRATFRKLPLRRREAIYLRYYQRLSYSQISETMEIQYQTVRDLISKGIKTLREQLKQALVVHE